MSAKVPTRPLGKHGPQVSRLGYGAMGLSAVLYGQSPPQEERLKVLDRVFELGCRFWDTAEGYGDNEDLIGEWFEKTGKRNEVHWRYHFQSYMASHLLKDYGAAKVFLATKFAVKMSGAQRILSNDPEYIRKAIDTSLQRLKTDHIDLWYCHRFDGKVPVETVVRTMAEAVKAGKVSHLGLSECSSATLRRAHAVHPITAVQIEYSPFTLDIESPEINLLQTCRDLGVAVVAYSPLGRGMLTGQYKSNRDFDEGDWRRTAPRFSDENFPKNLVLVEKLKAIADSKGCTTGQLTLAWLLSQGDDIFPIPGTKNIKYLEENISALAVHLTDDEVHTIRKAVESAGETSGDRYPENMQQLNFMDTPPLES